MKSKLASISLIFTFIISNFLIFDQNLYNLETYNDNTKHKAIQRSNQRTPRKGLTNGSLKHK